MKKIVRASSQEYLKAVTHAKTIKKYGQLLLDAMENTPSGFLDANDLGPLYEELIEVLPSLDFAINSGSVEYNKDNYGVISR